MDKLPAFDKAAGRPSVWEWAPVVLATLAAVLALLLVFQPFTKLPPVSLGLHPEPSATH